MDPGLLIFIIPCAVMLGFSLGTLAENKETAKQRTHYKTHAEGAYFLALHGWKPDSKYVNEWTYWRAPDLDLKWDMDDAIKRQKLLNKAERLRVAPELLEKPAEVAVRTYTPEGWR